MALDLLLLNQLQRLNRNAGFNEFFPRRPVCAYFSGINNSYNFVVDFFAEYSTVPMRTMASGNQAWGAFPSIAVSTVTEANVSYYWGGSTGTVSTNSFSAGAGMVGITGHAQTRCLNNVDFTSEEFFAFNASNYHMVLERSCGVILGETGYRQGLNLYKSGVNIYVSYVGDVNTLNVSAGVNNGDKAFAWTALTGLTRLAGAISAGMGDIGYNRKTNTLAFIESTNDGSYNYRLHIFKNLPKLRASAEHLRVALNAAIAGGAATYETFDFTWSTGNTNDNEWNQRTRIIPCDDGTFWLARMVTGQGVALGRIYGTPRTFVFVRHVVGTGTYSSTTGAYYGIRHMNSDDGTMVAVYCQYSSYMAGACIIFVPRNSAADTTKHNFMQYADTTNGCSIAPSGGPNFVIGVNSNADTRTVDGYQTLFDNPASLAQTSLSFNANAYNISGYTQSTSYGGTGFIKVQDPLALTTEWRERVL